MPRTPDFNNSVYSFQNGYYAHAVRRAFVVNDPFLNREKELYEANGSGFTIPRITQANQLPQDLQDLGLNLSSYYIIVVRIEDDFVVERYQFAQ